MPEIQAAIAVIKNDIQYIKGSVDAVATTVGDMSEILRKQNEERIRLEVIQKGHGIALSETKKDVDALKATKNKIIGWSIAAFATSGAGIMAAFKSVGGLLK